MKSTGMRVVNQQHSNQQIYNEQDNTIVFFYLEIKDRIQDEAVEHLSSWRPAN